MSSASRLPRGRSPSACGTAGRVHGDDRRDKAVSDTSRAADGQVGAPSLADRADKRELGVLPQRRRHDRADEVLRAHGPSVSQAS